MRELKVTQQSPQSHIVVQCHRCGTSWYIRPDAGDDDADSPRAQLNAAVDHDCREQVMEGRQYQGVETYPHPRTAARPKPMPDPG